MFTKGPFNSVDKLVEAAKEVSETSPFDPNYKSQMQDKKGEKAGFDSKKLSTGTLYTRKPPKQPVEKEQVGEEKLDEISKKTAHSYLKHKLADPAQSAVKSKGEVHRSFKGIARATERMTGRVATSEDHGDEAEDKALVKSMVKKDALKKETKGESIGEAKGDRSEYTANLSMQKGGGTYKPKHHIMSPGGSKISSHDTEGEAIKAFNKLGHTRGVKIVKEELDGSLVTVMEGEVSHPIMARIHSRMKNVVKNPTMKKFHQDQEERHSKLAKDKGEKVDIKHESVEESLGEKVTPKTNVTADLKSKKKENVAERELTPGETKKKETIAKKMKPALKSFKDRYGADKGKSVFYAVATKRAKGESIGEQKEADEVKDSERSSIKVGDTIECGQMEKGGKGVRGTVRRIDGDKVHINVDGNDVPRIGYLKHSVKVK